jgi:hypothetical protein
LEEEEGERRRGGGRREGRTRDVGGLGHHDGVLQRIDLEDLL